MRQDSATGINSALRKDSNSFANINTATRVHPKVRQLQIEEEDEQLGPFANLKEEVVGEDL